MYSTQCTLQSKGRNGNWMQTASGGQFWPSDPHPDDINISDIASALSKICRFGGHSLHFYSVAEHSVHMASLAPAGQKLTALLHDASEAYLIDIPRPIKLMLADYRDLESRIMTTIMDKYGAEWPLPTSIKKLDSAMLATERIYLMAKCETPWEIDEKPIPGIEFGCWNPDKAKSEFLNLFHSIT